MRLAILVLLQVLLFLPITSFAADMGKTPLLQNNKTTEVTEARKAGLVKTYGNLPLYFIENRGQADGKVSFYERGAGHATFFTGDGVVLALSKKESKTYKPSFTEDILGLKTEDFAKTTTEALSLSFVGANKEARITADDKKTGHVNYFIGNDKTKWRSNIPTYGAVTYEDVYKNIDIRFYGNNKNMEHDVIVKPGGDISNVKFAYKGIKGLKVTEGGDLEVALKKGKIIEQRPVIYQEIGGRRVAVEGSYRILKRGDGAFEYGFDVASYDHSKKIVIDPVLVYSTYLGGSGADFGSNIAVDSLGAAYITGSTDSADFPLMNPIQAANGGGLYDVFVTKINPAGTALVYSTYLGGTGNDQGFGIDVDGTGSVYVTGQTDSTNFPLMNPVQFFFGGGFSDAFVTKINPTGTAFVYSTYLGGTGPDVAFGIAVDSSGSTYVTGRTSSTDYPIANAMQGISGGFGDAFVTKIDPAGSILTYSTYLGGSDNDSGFAIDVDGSGSAYVTGDTLSPDFPVINPIQAFNAGSFDVFVLKINPAGTALVYSTYLGGTGDEDLGGSIAVDASGSAYVSGTTPSTDFPIVNAVQGIFGGGFDDAFITKIDPAGTAFVYSTYLGGSGLDFGGGIAVDAAGNAYETGFTSSTDFPVVAPIQAVNVGGGDAFITKIDPAGTAFVYSTYLGGTAGANGQGIAVDSSGAAYVTGFTLSTDFPLINPIQGASGGGFDAFIAKISGSAPPPPPAPVVTLTLLPDAATVAQGTTLGYNVTATNNTAVQQCFNYWENVNLPGGALFPATDSLFKPVPRLCLNGGASKTVHLTHGVPLTAPIGAYVFNSYVGIFPFNFRAVVDTTSFNFNVTAGVAPIPNPQTSWRVIENGFRR